MAKSKQKGNRFETETAKILSERFQPRLGVSTGFYRSTDSGAYYGGSNVQRMETHSLDYAVFGDIVAPRDFRFIIECKHYAKAPTLTSVFTGCAQWDGWIGEAEYDSKSSGKDWLLIMKYNNVKPMVVFHEGIIEHPFSFELKYQEKYRIVSLAELLGIEDDFWFIS